MVFGGLKGDVAARDNIHPYWDAEKRHEIESFKSQCDALSFKLLEIFATKLGLPPAYFTSAHDDACGPPNALRMLHYPKLETRVDDDLPRLRPHTDWGSLTFVWPRSGGLEVETPSGKWKEVPLVPGGVVVNIGDALDLWSGGVLKSTLHRISFKNLPFDRSRWSMAYFVNPNKGESFLRRGLLVEREDELTTT